MAVKSYVTHPTNIDRIVNKILDDDKMTPSKIKALSSVIASLKGIPLNEPNELEPSKEDQNEMMLSEEQPINMSEVTGVSIDNEKIRGVKIYKSGLPS